MAGQVEITGFRPMLTCRAARLRSEVYFNKSCKVRKDEVKAGDEELALQGGTAVCKQIEYMTLEAVSVQSQDVNPLIINTVKPLANPGTACLQRSAVNEEALCIAQQIGSRAQSVTGFSDSQPSCLVITPTLINFKVQWCKKFPPLTAISAKTQFHLQI